MTGAQCRAARALLGWTINELADRAEVSSTSIVTFENERRSPHRGTLKSIRTALEAAGIRFLENGEGPGLRLVTPAENREDDNRD